MESLIIVFHWTSEKLHCLYAVCTRTGMNITHAVLICTFNTHLHTVYIYIYVHVYNICCHHNTNRIYRIIAKAVCELCFTHIVLAASSLRSISKQTNEQKHISILPSIYLISYHQTVLIYWSQSSIDHAIFTSDDRSQHCILDPKNQLNCLFLHGFHASFH